MTEDKMVGWHHQLNGHEFEQAPGDDKGRGSLASCSSWGRKELNMTERLNTLSYTMTCTFSLHSTAVPTLCNDKNALHPVC